MEEVKTAGGEVLYAAAATSDTDIVTQLYKSYDELNNPAFEGDKSAAYSAMLAAGAKDAPPQAKMLVAELIPKFFSQFAATNADAAIMRQVDLCEDDGDRGLQIRTTAMRGLPQLCGDDAETVSRIANMLGQMLMNDSEQEQTIVREGLVTLLKRNVQGGLAALFVHISSDDEALRAKVVEFLLDNKLRGLLRSLLSKDEATQTWFVDQVAAASAKLDDKVLRGLLMLAGQLKANRTPEGNEKLLGIVAARAGLGDEFKADDVDAVRRFTSAFESAQFYFRRGAKSDAWVSTLVNQVMPVLPTLPDDAALGAAKALAEVAPQITATQAVALLPVVYAALKAQLPPPTPAVAEGEAAPPAPKVNFSLVECLVYAFHAVAAKHRTSLPELCGLRVTAAPVFTGQPQDIMGTPSENTAEKAVFVAALLRLAPIVKDFQSKFVQARKQLNQSKDMDKEQRKLVQRAIDTTRNISVMTTALTKEQPTLVPIERIVLSFRSRQGKKGGEAQGKGKGKGGNQQGGNKKGQQQGQGKRKKGGQQQQQQGQGKKKKGGQQQQGQGKKKGGGGQQQGQGKKKGGGGQQQTGKKRKSVGGGGGGGGGNNNNNNNGGGGGQQGRKNKNKNKGGNNNNGNNNQGQGKRKRQRGGGGGGNNNGGGGGGGGGGRRNRGGGGGGPRRF